MGIWQPSRRGSVQTPKARQERERSEAAMAELAADQHVRYIVTVEKILNWVHTVGVSGRLQLGAGPIDGDAGASSGVGWICTVLRR
ncbi:hypothetical protein GQ55_4G043700 [Panicum hallii var. hallii]|uniref:Uncharacterized protein n=2 Tax=Panicum hallii TaxID=206008 RepID=A0A2T7DV62_9POAL|nr:hypothetical protein GQ55_4G043700 [Panicum hallii var. hallii]PVH36650.1 hypothetical protein PAHAL_6G131100 [Panicum hallii]